MGFVEGHAEVDEAAGGGLGGRRFRVVVAVCEDGDGQGAEVLGVGDVADVGQGVVERGLNERVMFPGGLWNPPLVEQTPVTARRMASYPSFFWVTRIPPPFSQRCTPYSHVAPSNCGERTTMVSSAS